MATTEQERLARAPATGEMTAAVVEDFTKPLVVKRVPKPVPGPQEILVRVETSGLCHTDIHAAHADEGTAREHRPGHGVHIRSLAGYSSDTR